MAIKFHMQSHAKRSADLLAAVIAGDIATAQTHATWLAEHPSDESLQAWEPSIDTLRAAAKPGKTATNLFGMSKVVANVGAACGECHVASASIPVFPSVDRPDVADTSNRMRLHQWAADRMWEGLVAPSDKLWNDGVSALAVAPLHDDEIMKNASAAPTIVAQARAVHDLGNEGSNATTAQARAEVYARFVENCASCHHQLGMGDTEK